MAGHRQPKVGERRASYARSSLCGLCRRGLVAAPEPVMANDEPLGAITSPHFLYSSVDPHAIVTGHDMVIVVEASVNSRGRVYDFNVVSGPTDPAVRIQIMDQLLGSVFEPASVFGAPVRGRVVLTFSGISVHS